MNKAKKIVLLMGMLITVCSTAAFAGRGDDTLWPKHSLRLEMLGRSFLGGFTFERAWHNPAKAKHPRAFNSADLNIGYAGYTFILTSVAINRNWYLGARKKWIINCGPVLAARICVAPTPKETREYYDSIVVHGGEYINPVEPMLMANLSCRYTHNRMFAQLSFVPMLYYDRAYNTGFIAWPWGGLSVGLYLKNKTKE